MKNFLKSAILLILLLIISKFLGIIREVLLAQKFATSYITDAYIVAISLPTVIFTIFASGFSNSYVSVFMRIKSDRRYTFFNNTFYTLVVISIIISLICFFSSEWLVKILAPGFNGKDRLLTIFFVKIIVFYLPLYTAFNILSAHLMSNEKFFLTNFCNFIVANIIIILSIVFASIKNPNILIYGYVISMAVPVAILLIVFIKNKELKYNFSVNIKDNDFKQLFKIAFPLGLSSFVNQINGVIDKIFASLSESGIMSALSYANRLQILPYSLIISSFLTLLKPALNRNFANKDIKKAICNGQFIILSSFYTCIPISFFLYKFSFPIVSLLLERGIFSSKSTFLVSTCLSYYAIGIPFYACREIITSILAANYKQKSILKNTVLCVVLNIVLNLIFTKIIGYKGLPLSTSLIGVFSCVLMIYDLKRLNIMIFTKKVTKEIGKISLNAIIVVTFSNFLYEILKDKLNYNVVVYISFIFGFIYIIFSFIFKIKIIEYMYKKLIKNRILSNRKNTTYKLP